MPAAPVNPESAVRARYSAAAQERETALCCPVEYDARYLEAIPKRVLERDYGCGDPSRYLRPGDAVLDLGSGGGKIAFIASQIVGRQGSVVGVDVNDEMLALARGAAAEVAESIGFANVRFRRGRIQELSLDFDRLDDWLREHPVRSSAELAPLEEECERLRREEPLVADESVDVVVSNCVLNLVAERDKSQLIREIFRVLRRDGRIAISDIVSDRPIPAALRADPELWSGCISGAFQERDLLFELEDAGFHSVRVAERADQPFAVVDDIDFRSITLTGAKGAPVCCG